MPDGRVPMTNPGETEAERWVWDEIRAGREADLTRRFGQLLDPRNGRDPRWHDGSRVIGAGFIQTVLTAPVWRDAMDFRGLRIGGARIPGKLDLRSAPIAAAVWLDLCRFEEEVVLEEANFAQHLTFDGSTFEAGLKGHGVRIGGRLSLKRLKDIPALVRGDRLTLEHARVDGTLELTGSEFEAGVAADGLRVGGALFMHGAAAVRGGALTLDGAGVEGDLYMEDSIFEAGVAANRLRVGGSLFMRDAALLGPALSMIGTFVKGDIDMDRCVLAAGMEAERLQLGGSLFLRRVSAGADASAGGEGGGQGTHDGATGDSPEAPAFSQPVDGASILIIDSHIAKGVYLAGAQLGALWLGGTKIDGELNLAGNDGAVPRWTAEAELNLRNTHVGALRDRWDAWPGPTGKLELNGFTYDRLGGISGSGEEAALRRPVGWYAGWIERDKDFSRQPYQQLAAVFRAAGYPDRADEILYAARDRERCEAWGEARRAGPRRWAALGRALGLEMLRVAIGYGLTGHFFRQVALLVIAFTALGAAVLWASPAAAGRGLGWCIGASLDQLLPIVELNKEFGEFFNDPGRARLAGWQMLYFGWHALLGYALGVFVAAGLAGLTQARR